MSHVVSTGSERTVDLRRRNFDREILTDPCETSVTRARVSSLTILRVFQMYQDPKKDTKDEKEDGTWSSNFPARMFYHLRRERGSSKFFLS